MSFDGSRREYLYSIYIKKNPTELSEKIGIILSENDIMLERVYVDKNFKRRVDISAAEKEKQLFCEMQLTKSDEIHYRQIVELISLAKNDKSTLIAWIATEFTDKYITELKQLIITNSKKNIELLFLIINKDVIKQLVEINKCNKYKQIEMLKQLNNIKEHFLLISSIKNYYNVSKVNSVKDDIKVMSYKQKILIKICKRLRQDCSNQGNVYQYKDVTGNCFIMGTGYGGIDYKVMADRRNRIGIVLAFNNIKSKKAYYKLKTKREKIDDEFDFMLDWNDEYNQIATFLALGWFNDKEKIILIFCRIVKRYLYCFDKYLEEVLK
ncbi:hypothetical protein [Clostridium ljungdahlii]|uniref:DUF4268 domain-containing protein n=1 Tax=Clostridium ljungdahlii TaxID=1538 RepID=A0A168PIB1_9CLOT|nr:hypothetical protein [Clostridium ljungdahlii]OAA87781.1 hypothetical protein WY13_01896 [Clostridium ljungdahlii]